MSKILWEMVTLVLEDLITNPYSLSMKTIFITTIYYVKY